MKIKAEDFSVKGCLDKVLFGTCYIPKESNCSTPIFVLCHGFGVSKDWGFLPVLSRLIAENGIVSLCFNFSHSGVKRNETKVTELDIFKQNSLSKEKEDLIKLLENLTSNSFLSFYNNYDKAQIFIGGYSRGADATLSVATLELPFIKGVVTLAAKSKIKNIPFLIEKKWRKDEVKYVPDFNNMLLLPLGTELLEDLTKSKNIIEQNIKSIKTPILIIHGEDDKNTPVKSAYCLNRWARNSTLTIISRANHNFGHDDSSINLSIIEKVAYEIACFVKNNQNTKDS